MEQIAILDVLRRHVRLIVALTIVTGIAGYAISYVSYVIPERYDATATVMVRPHDPIKMDPTSGAKEISGFPVAQTPVVESASKTYIQIIQSPALVGEVVRDLGLDQKKPKKPPADTIWGRTSAYLKDVIGDLLDYLKDGIAFVRYGRVIKDDPFIKSVKDVTKGLILKSYEDTYIFEIKFGADDPKVAAAVANATARLFIEFLDSLRSSEAKDAAARLNAQLVESRQRLVAARESLEGYKTSHQVFLYESYYDSKLREMSDLTVELTRFDESSIGRLTGGGAYDQKRAILVQRIDELRGEIAQLPTIERELQLRQSDVDVANTAYATVAKQLKDLEIKSDSIPDARLISEAFVSELPTSPRREIYLGASLLAGLLFGVLIAFLLEYMNGKVRGIGDIEEFVGVKVIGAIPRMRFPQLTQGGG